MESRDMLRTLTEYSERDYVPMHMPGAKRNVDFAGSELLHMGNPYNLDITEIDGFDNMHNPQGLIRDAFDRCAVAFHADESLFLVNGSSAGILSAICGATDKGDKVVVARNSHISVYNALYINELTPMYVYPAINEFGFSQGIDPQDVEELLKKHNGDYIKDYKKSQADNKLIKAVIITSPTYEGVVSDVKAIAEVAHKYGAVLIVDEAHGAHFVCHKIFPKSANECNADVVIQSVHKTLPSLTQTALLHMNGSFIDRERVKMYWNIFQTTSPSYVLMSSIDRCVTIVKEGAKFFEEYVARLCELRTRLSTLKNIRLCEVDDISKLVLAVRDGKWLYNKLLKDYHIQLEMASDAYVIAMTGVADKSEYYERLYNALKSIDENDLSKTHKDESGSQASKHRISSFAVSVHKSVCSIYEAVNGDKESVSLDDAVGRVSGAKICLYPPGIPLVVEGEIITKDDVITIADALERGIDVMGVNNNEKEVEVLCLR